ncbi:hypothetical protein F2Q70_00023721 [Brassica cretica]|uniref:RRM domain-containing protein n=1 Tax=Brassica cretica TaxID=69181 RepID=A0A8S9GUL1_BRACR|nr:hypothetical protein F2Q70_00023721 [Brassica cretica]
MLATSPLEQGNAILNTSSANTEVSFCWFCFEYASMVQLILRFLDLEVCGERESFGGSVCCVCFGGEHGNNLKSDVLIRDLDMKRDYAFIEFSDPRDADDARYRLDGRDFDGSRITVERDASYSRSPVRSRSRSPPRRRRRSPSRSYSRDRSYSRSRSPVRKETDRSPGAAMSRSPEAARSRSPEAARSRSPELMVDNSPPSKDRKRSLTPEEGSPMREKNSSKEKELSPRGNDDGGIGTNEQDRSPSPREDRSPVEDDEQ